MVWRSKNFFKNNKNSWIWVFFLLFSILSIVTFKYKDYNSFRFMMSITLLFLGGLIFSYARFPSMKTYDKYCSRFTKGALDRATEHFNFNVATNPFEYINPIVFWGYDTDNATHKKRDTEEEDGTFEGMFRTNLIRVTVLFVHNHKMYVYIELYDALKRKGKDKLGVGGYVIPFKDIDEVKVCALSKGDNNSFFFIYRFKNLPKLPATGAVPYAAPSIVTTVYDAEGLKILIARLNEFLFAEKREELEKRKQIESGFFQVKK